MSLVKTISTTILLVLPIAAIANKEQKTYLPEAYSCLDEYQLNNFDLAVAECLPAANKNDPLAQYVVGMMYKRGKGVKVSQAQALKWLTRSADGGYDAAQLKLGKMISAGTSSAPNYAAAFELFTKAANQNNSEAQFLLALCYQNGLGTKQDITTALNWYHKAIQNGLDAPNIASNASDKQNQHIAKNEPGYEEFKTALKQKTDSFVWLKLAAEKGHAQAQYQVGMHYVNGKDTEQDDAKALQWLQKSAAQGYRPAQSYLAWMAMLGLGTHQDLNEAIHWFVSAHEPKTSDKVAFTTLNKPQSQLAAKEQPKMLYENAMKLLEIKDDPDTLQQGIALLEAAARSNLPIAQFTLGSLYQTGINVKADQATAIRWFEKAARNGNSDAQYALGWIYFNGEGVVKNLPQAYHWFNQAAAYGGQRAKSAKQFVRSQMNPSQMAKLDKQQQKVAAK